MFSMLGRYIFLAVFAFPGVKLIYYIFTPLTIYPSSWILSILYDRVSVFPGTSTIFVSGSYIDIVEACVAGAAYFLLIVLNMTTPMPVKTRIKSLAIIIFSFLIINIIRIVVFIALYNSGYDYFDITHKIVWYAGSTLLIVVIWFSQDLILKLKVIPLYTDIKSVIKDIRQGDKIAG